MKGKGRSPQLFRRSIAMPGMRTARGMQRGHRLRLEVVQGRAPRTAIITATLEVNGNLVPFASEAPSRADRTRIWSQSPCIRPAAPEWASRFREASWLTRGMRSRVKGDTHIAGSKRWQRLASAVESPASQAKPPAVRWSSYDGRTRKCRGIARAGGCRGRWHEWHLDFRKWFPDRGIGRSREFWL